MTLDDRFETPLPAHWRRRLHQVHRYLVAHFPAAYETRLVLRAPAARYEAVARIDVDPARRLRISLDPRLQWYGALDTLLHEWAHAMSWDGAEEHGPTWAGAFAALSHAFEDGDALKDSEAW